MIVHDRARGVDTPLLSERAPSALTVDPDSSQPRGGGTRGTDQHQLRQHIFGTEKSGKPLYVAVFSGKRPRNGGKELRETRTQYFRWPEEAAKITRAVQGESGREVYICAHLLTAKRRVKANAAPVLACYVDADGAQPSPDQPQPTAIVQSSPGREQYYYRLTKAIDPERAERLNRRLAHMMQADMSGWDLTQLLRPPGTKNWKYDNTPEVKLISIEDRAYDPDELERILPPLQEDAAPSVSVKLERVAAAPPVGDRDQRARDRMYAAKRGSEIQMLANGGSVHSKDDGGPDHSADDQSYINALAFWFDKDPARMAAELWRSGRVRDKWNEIHSADGRTYLEITIGKAIGGCAQSFRDLAGYDAGDEAPRMKPPVPVTIGNDGASVCPDDKPATLADALALVAQLRQENQELRESNHDLTVWVERMAGQAEEWQETARIQRERLVELRERLDGWKAILSNPKLKPSDRIVAIPIVETIKAAREHGQDNVHVRYPGIVKGWGMPESTVQKSAAVLTEMEGAVLAKHNEPDKPVLVDTKNGPKEVTPWKTIISANVDGNLYAAVGAYDPGLPQRGGKRTPLPRCKDHPEADLVVRAVTQCAECRKPLEAKERGIRRQNEGVSDPPPHVNDPGTYCRQNEGVDGHDGAEMAELAAPTEDQQSPRLQNDVTTPSFLSEWPDATDLDVEDDDITNVVTLPSPDQRKGFWSRPEYRRIATATVN